MERKNILNLSVKKLNDLLGPEKVFQNSDGEDDEGGGMRSKERKNK